MKIIFKMFTSRLNQISDLVFTRRKTILRVSDLVGEQNIFSQQLQPVFEIELSICRDMFGFNFIEGNYSHPYWEVCYLESLNNTDSQIHSIAKLQEYYRNFRPTSTMDAFSSRYPDGQGLKSFQLPWEEYPKTRKEGGCLKYSGPMDESDVYQEYKRIKSVFNSIKFNGYKPTSGRNLFKSGHIEGYFLKNGRDLRFIVVHGKHRIAALSALGHVKIPVTFCLARPRVVDFDYGFMPGLIHGSFSLKDLQLIKDKFFNR